MEAAVAVPERNCEKHPDRPLIGTCSRCGGFICIVCAPEFATHPEDPCEPCRAIVRVQDAPRARAAMINAAGAGGVLFGGVFFGMVAMIDRSADGDAVLFGGALMAAVPAILGVLMMLTRFRPLGWALTVVQGVLALMFMPSRLALLLAVFAVFTGGMTRQSRAGAHPEDG